MVDNIFFAPERAASSRERSLVVFRLGTRLFALPVEAVVQVIPMLRLAPLPLAGRLAEGFANIHGEIVPVLDARRYLGFPYADPTPGSPIILFRSRARTLGLLVDEVTEVLQLAPEQCASTESLMPEGMGSPAALRGMLSLADRALFLLDPERLLKPGQAQALDGAVQDLLASSGVPQNGAPRRLQSARRAHAHRREPGLVRASAANRVIIPPEPEPGDGPAARRQPTAGRQQTAWANEGENNK